MKTKTDDIIYHPTTQKTNYSLARLERIRNPQKDGIAQFRVLKNNNTEQITTQPRLKKILDKLKPDTIEATLQLKFLPLPSIGVDVKATWDFRKRKLVEILTTEQKIQLFQKYENLLL